MPEFNYLSIGLSVVASMVLGSIWYSPYAVGPMWMKLVGINKDKIKKQSMVWPLLSSVLSAALLGFILDNLQLPFLETFFMAIILWIVFCESISLQHFLYEGRSLKLYGLNAAYHFLTLLVISAVVSALHV